MATAGPEGLLCKHSQLHHSRSCIGDSPGYIPDPVLHSEYFSMVCYIPPEDQLALGAARELEWSLQVQRAIECLALGRRDARLLNTLLFERGIEGRLVLSNTHVRTASRHALHDVLSTAFAADPARQRYLLTVGGVRGVTDLLRPEIDLIAFRNGFDAVARRCGLTGIFSFELDIVRPTLNEVAHPVLWHAHGVVEAVDPSRFHLKELRATFAANRAFRAWNGGVGIHIKPIVRTAADMGMVAVYLADPVHQLKVRYPHPRIPGALKLRGTRSGYDPDVILRGTEMQSHISVYDAVFGIGAVGVELRAAWAQQMRAWERRRRCRHRVSQSVDCSVVEALWRRVHATNSDTGYEPCRIVTQSSAYAARKVE